MNEVFLSSLTIQPEVIPMDSDEGDKAKAVYPIWIYLFLFLIVFVLFVLVVRTLFTALLITIGIYFLWTKATNLLKSN